MQLETEMMDFRAALLNHQEVRCNADLTSACNWSQDTDSETYRIEEHKFLLDRIGVIYSIGQVGTGECEEECMGDLEMPPYDITEERLVILDQDKRRQPEA